MTHKSPDHPAGKRIALFPGSFNPFTIGHASIVERGLKLFDHIVIALGVNSAKQCDAAVSTRLEAIRAIYACEPRVTVVEYSGLTVDACRRHGANFILRGVRNAADMEYEHTMADANRNISGIETVLLYTLPELAWISSSIVRELQHHHHDVSHLLPPALKQ